MDKYSGMDVETLKEKLIGCYDFQERTKIRAAIKELQNPGNCGIKTYSFSQKYKRKTGSDSTPLGSPLLVPKSPLLSPKDFSSSRFQDGLSDPSKSYLKSPVGKNDVTKKERKQSWKETLKDVIERQTKRNSIRRERMSSSSSDGGGTKGADNVFVSSPVNKTFRSYLFAGNINSQKEDRDLLHCQSNLRKKFRLKSDGSDSETDKQDVSRTASVYTSRWSRLKSEESSSNNTPRNSQSSNKSFQETNLSPIRKMRLKSDGTPPSSPPHNANVPYHTSDDSFSEVSHSSRATSCKSVDSGYSSVSDRSQRERFEHQCDDKMPAGSYKARIARYRSHDTGQDEPTKYVSKTVWRSSLQEHHDDSVFKKETSHSSRVNKKPPPSQRKISRIKSDENLLDDPRELRKTSNLQNSEISFDGDVRVSPTERKMIRVKSDSNLLNSHLTSRTVNRASLLDKELDQSPSRLGNKATRITDARYGFSRIPRDKDRKDTENGFKDTGSTKVKVRDSSPSGLSLKLDRSISTPDDGQPDSPARLRLQERMRRRVSESDATRAIEASSSVFIDVDRNFTSTVEVEAAIVNLQDQLKLSTDFSERRKIRAAIRRLREKKQALESCETACDKTPVISQVEREISCERDTTPLSKVDQDLSSLNGYSDIESIPELRRLLTEETDYDEKRKIRLALRHLRQRERERESGDQPVNGRNLTRSHSFVDRRQKNFVHDSNGSQSSSTSHSKEGNSSNIPENGISQQNGEVILNGHVDRSHDRTAVNQQRRFSDFSGNSVKTSYRRSSDASQTDGHNTVLSKDKPYHLSSPTVSRDAGSPVLKSSEKEGENKPSYQSSLSIAHLRSNRTFSPPPKVSPSSSSSPKSPSASSSSQTSPTTHSSSKLSPTTTAPLQSLPASPSSPSPVSRNVKDIHIHSDKSLDPCQTPNSPKFGEASPKYQRRFSLSSIPPKKDDVKDKEEIKPESDFEALGKSWIEKKKRSCSLPGNSKALDSTDMEAAFSELLSAVDQPQSSVNTSNDLDLVVEDTKVDINENETIEEEIIKKTVKDTRSSPTPDKESDKQLVTTPLKGLEKSQLFLDVNSTPEKNSAISIIEDDDGAVSVSSTSRKNVGDTVITQKMKLRRSESNTEEEERDTIIETKLTSPGGTYHYEKDVTKSKRKITQRGSDYFSRSKYVVRKKRDDSGDEIEEHDISLETDNFSVTKGESWGDKAEAKVEMMKPMDTLLPLKQTSKDVGDKTGGRMNVSKTSSGYGSVSGSDEEEREETMIIYGHQGKPSGSPEIRTTLKEVLALEGSTAMLECAVMCSPAPTVSWFKDNKALGSSVRYDTKFDGPSGKATLTIKNSGMNDMGEYKCNFRNPLGEAETTSKLVIKKKATKKPEFKKRLKEQSVTEGQSVELECVVKEASTVSWYKDGIIQRNSADFKQTFDGVTAKLEISEIFLDDKGEYACVAKNDLGETKTVCKINVKETASDANVAPIFLTKPGSKILNGGDTLLLDCDVIGTPKPKITWTCDGNKLTSGKGHKETYDGRVATLRISDAGKDDSGKYECTAENAEGKVTVDALVVVKAKQGPPMILHQLSDISVVVGKSVTLQCDVRATPVPMIMWRKDGQVIGNMPDFHQTYDSNVARLTIKEVFEQDNGRYDCVARNSFGSVTSTCKLTVTDEESAKTKMSPKLGVRNKTPQKTDWIVGRDKGQTVAPTLTSVKDSGVKRSESMKVTMDSSVRDRFLKKADDKNTVSTSGKEEFSKVLNGLGKSNKVTDDSKDNPFKSLKDNEPKRVSPFRDLEKSKDKPKVDNDPPWKNVSLRRTESARVPTKPVWSRDKAEEKQVAQSDKTTQPTTQISTGALSDMKSSIKTSVEKTDSTSTVLPQKDTPPRPTITLRRSESARTGQPLFQKKDFLARAIDLAMEKSKQQEINNNRYQVIEESPPSKSSSSSLPSSEKEQEKKSLKTDTSANGATEEKTGSTKLGRTQSARLLFENKCNSTDVKPETPLASFLARRDNGVRRTSSLKVTPAEKEAGWFRNKSQHNGLDSSPLAKGDKSTMPSYETMDDEEELHKILSKTEDFEERKKIRTRMRELREIKSKEIEERRIQREKENEDIIRRRHEQADKQKAKTMAEFDKMAKKTSEQHNKVLEASQSTLQEKLRRAEEDKAKTLAAYDDIARKGKTHTTTVSKTEEIPGGSRTTVIKKTETTAGFGGIDYTAKPTAEQAAKFLTEQLKNASCIGTEGKISVKTESWSSRDGVTHTSQKSEAWGAKPGAGGAMAAFKKMDSAAAPPGGGRPNGLLAVSYAKKAATTMRRNAVAIKQEILTFVKKNTEAYEGIEVTNFSSSWNNGMAFCALIHNFYPDSFDITKLNPKNRRANFTLAFDTAEKVADIAPLLDVEDMVRMKNPDWKCVFTYVQSFYRKLHNHEANKVKQSSEQ